MFERYRDVYRMFVDIINGRIAYTKLRFDRTYVTVSEIAQQFYCEHKLTLMHREGKIETEDMRLGTFIHEETFRGKRLSVDDLLSLIEERERLYVTLPVCILFDNVPIVGVPDAVLIENGKVSAVIELKTTERWLNKVFLCEYVQANLYAYMFNTWGLTYNDCKVIIIKLLRKDVDIISEELLRKMFNAVEKVLNFDYASYATTYQSKKFVIHRFDLDRSITEYVKWALGYWKNTREEYVPEVTTRCAKCEYRHICKHAKQREESRKACAQTS